MHSSKDIKFTQTFRIREILLHSIPTDGFGIFMTYTFRLGKAFGGLDPEDTLLSTKSFRNINLFRYFIYVCGKD